MQLSSSHPHDDLWIDGLGGGIVVWPMDLPYPLSVRTDAGVGSRVGVRIGPILQVEDDVGRRLALVC